MADLDEVAKDPRYDQAATGASKTTIFVFVATFLYLVFFSRVAPGILGGFLFFVVGIFVASILISMPLFLLKLKFPISAPFVAVADVAITIVITRTIYLWLFAAEVPATVAVPIESFEPRTFTCEEPLPEFTLSDTSNPTDAELDHLCGCIFAALEVNDREISKAIAEGRESAVTRADIQRFTAKFGASVERCGGYEL